MRDADNPRVVPVLVDLPDFVGVGVLVVQLDVVLASVEAVSVRREMRVVRRAVLTGELPAVPAALGCPALLVGFVSIAVGLRGGEPD